MAKQTLKSCGVNTARFLKYVWPFYNIMHERVKKSELKQKLFHEHYCSEGHQGIENWSIILIDQVEDLDLLRKKELYWINWLNTWALNGLNVREVYEAYN